MPDELEALPVTERLAVVAVGGNALIPSDVVGTHKEQVRAARGLARSILVMLREGYRVLVVHGNGPQVGRELILNEEASTKIPPRPLDVCVAATQGTMGYLIGHQLRNELKKAGLKRPVSNVTTTVLVSRQDPAFGRPTKPVGPFYSEYRARELSKGSSGYEMVEDSGRGYRRVVASPKPLDVIDLDSVDALLAAGHVVIAGGGGGVPVIVNDRGELEGVEAVIDKDRTSALMGNLLGADVLILLTGIEHVFVNFGRTDQRMLEHVTVDELRAHHDAGQFPAGSMGPKVEAALSFLDDGGATAVITSIDKLAAAINDRTGTRITRELGEHAVRRQLDLFGTTTPEPERST